MNASSLGSAAAMQVLKKFTSGGSSESSHSSSKESSSGGTSQLISMAMAEASKLFDKSGGASSGNKQDAVNSAAMTVMKLLVQSKFKQTTGGSDSGGLSSLMGLVCISPSAQVALLIACVSRPASSCKLVRLSDRKNKSIVLY